MDRDDFGTEGVGSIAFNNTAFPKKVGGTHSRDNYHEWERGDKPLKVWCSCLVFLFGAPNHGAQSKMCGIFGLLLLDDTPGRDVHNA